MNMKEFEGSLRAAIARDEKWIKKILLLIHKLELRPGDKTNTLDPVINLGMKIRRQIEAYEKTLKKISKAGK